MTTTLGVLYIIVGFFLAGIYSGSTGSASTWDKASIVLFWLPGIGYIAGYKLGRDHRMSVGSPESGGPR